jgi:hypothetical protein
MIFIPIGVYPTIPLNTSPFNIRAMVLGELIIEDTGNITGQRVLDVDLK